MHTGEVFQNISETSVLGCLRPILALGQHHKSQVICTTGVAK